MSISGPDSVTYGSTLNLTATITGVPAGVSISYNWTSSDTAKATVTANAANSATAVVTGVTTGSVTITVQAVLSDGRTINTTKDITVTAPIPPAGFVTVTGATVTGQIQDSEIFISGRTVHIRNLFVCEHEVTQEEYVDIIGNNPSEFNGSYGKEAAPGEDQNKRPVDYVSWYDTLVYCNKRSMTENLTPCYTIDGSTDPDDWGTVPSGNNATWNAAICDFNANGYRLPTEAEWEYAARGGNNGIPSTQTTFTGNDDPDAVAWFNGNSSSKTHQVMRKDPNDLGLYDMSGNVCEWCWDWYDGMIDTDTPDTGAPSGMSNYRILRGGSWYCSDTYPSYASVYYRTSYYLYYRWNDMGFRVVRTIP